MKFAKPIAIVLGVLVVGAIAVFLVLSNAQDKEHRQRIESLDRLEQIQRNAEASAAQALELQERAAKLMPQTAPSR